jgi:hypothetical protein
MMVFMHHGGRGGHGGHGAAHTGSRDEVHTTKK